MNVFQCHPWLLSFFFCFYYLILLFHITMYYLFYLLGFLESGHLAKWSHQYNNDLIMITSNQNIQLVISTYN